MLFQTNRRNELDYLGLRFWIGMWIALILLVLVAIDASAIVCYITRFTEENFALLIATIFIYKVMTLLSRIYVRKLINFVEFCIPTGYRESDIHRAKVSDESTHH